MTSPITFDEFWNIVHHCIEVVILGILIWVIVTRMPKN